MLQETRNYKQNKTRDSIVYTSTIQKTAEHSQKNVNLFCNIGIVTFSAAKCAQKQLYTCISYIYNMGDFTSYGFIKRN
jgi:hypothetical protein